MSIRVIQNTLEQAQKTVYIAFQRSDTQLSSCFMARTLFASWHFGIDQ